VWQIVGGIQHCKCHSADGRPVKPCSVERFERLWISLVDHGQQEMLGASDLVPLGGKVPCGLLCLHGQKAGASAAARLGIRNARNERAPKR
jgi:hypothetical protein